MLTGKKKFWLLAAIPLYIIYVALAYLFFEIKIVPGNIVALSVFTLSVTMSYAVQKRALKLIIPIALHSALILSVLLLPALLKVKWQALLVYAFVYLPVLLILPEKNERQSKKTKGSKKMKASASAKSFLFDSLMIFLPILLAVLLISGAQSMGVAFIPAQGLYILCFVFILCYLRYLRRHNGTKASGTSATLVRLSILSIENALMCLLWGNQYVNDSLYLLFPLFLALLLLTERGSE